jgi:hypothetical protein
MTGNFGFVFRCDGKGNFGFVPPSRSGISVNGDVREIIYRDEELIFALNGQSLKFYRKNPR